MSQWLAVLLLAAAGSALAAAAQVEEGTISISLNRKRAARGERVEVTLQVAGRSGQASAPVSAVLLRPVLGAERLELRAVADRPGAYRAEILLDERAASGLHVIHAWTGAAENPSRVGKASFLLDRMVIDFLIAHMLDKAQPQRDLKAYLDDFQRVGGNLLIAHNLIIPDGALYPSKVCRTDVAAGSPRDMVEMILGEADRRGLAVMLSVSWDMTRRSHFRERMKEIKAIMNELYALYRHHPSLAGFYSYQEGSGTYYVDYVREFSQEVKRLDTGLLAACAPHIDDPLLAGYLSTVEELDVMIYQSGVMASYRPDNRKKYPLRRVKDFCALGAGAKRLQDKFAITHVEVFGYLENRISSEHAATTYENIHPQILSAATVADADGISLFSYHAHVYEPSKRDSRVARSRAAVADGLKAYALIAGQIARARNPLAVYFPYSDWIIERWPNYFLPALDAFRALGLAVDVLPYAPPLEESVYPYYPFHMNRDVLARLLRERTVLLMPNVSGFQQTDSDLVREFIAQGGVVVAFGPQIPMGRSYERSELFGGDEAETKARASLTVNDAFGSRVAAGTRYALRGQELASWKAGGAKVLAAFDDGSAAVLANRYGKGMAIAVLPDAATLAEHAPELAREIIDYALQASSASRSADILGLNENVDLAMQETTTGFRLALVNHNEREMEAEIRPIDGGESEVIEWIDIFSGDIIKRGAERFLKVRIGGGGVRAIELRRAGRR